MKTDGLALGGAVSLLLAAGPAVTPVAGESTRGGELGVPLPLFPANNWWNEDISAAPVDPASSSYIAFVGASRTMHPDFGGYADPGPPPGDEIYGFPYIVVNDPLPAKKAVDFLYWDESDGVHLGTGVPFPFYPIPDEAIAEPYWIEGGPAGNENVGGDRHILIVDRARNHLYELYDMFWNGAGWEGGSGAFFDLATNERRPEGWTSADAAGLAILPGLVRYDEVYESGSEPIRHALRVTVRTTNGHVYPASHSAGSTSGALPMGARLRLKASVDLGAVTSDPNVRKIFQAMKTYGLIVADNGSDLYVSGTFDPRWDNGVLNPAFARVEASDFEVVQLGYAPAARTLAVADASPLVEGNTGSQAMSFAVNLDAPASGTVTVSYQTSNGTATGGSDFTPLSSLLSFSPGEVTKIVNVAVSGDSMFETDEVLYLDLSDPSGASLRDARGEGWIVNDDTEPTATITGFTPASASILAAVTIAGSDLAGASDVSFNGLSASFVVVSDTTLRAILPIGATSGPIAVTTSSGLVTSAAPFVVTPPSGFTVTSTGSGPGSLPGRSHRRTRGRGSTTCASISPGLVSTSSKSTHRSS